MTATLAVALSLAIVTYYLAANGKINYFPTYLAGLAFVGLCFDRTLLRLLVSDRVAWAALVLVIYLAATTLWTAPAHTPLLLGYALLLLAFVFGIAIVHARFHWFLTGFITLLILSAVVSGIYSVYFFYALDYNPLDEKDRLYALGRLGSPVGGALSYGVALILATSRVATASALTERILWGGAAIFLLYTTGLTGTRSVWPGLLAAAIALVVMQHNRSLRGRVILASAIVAASVAVLATAIAFGYGDELLRRSTSFRPEIWSATLLLLAESWLFGAGITADSTLYWQGLVFEHPHSIYFSTLFYGGAVGLVLLLGLIVLSVMRLVKARGDAFAAGALALLAFGAVTLAVDGNRVLEKMDFVWLAFWLPIALAISTRAIGSDRSE